MSSIGGTTTANGPSSTAEQAKEKAAEGAQQAKRTVRDQVDQRSTDAGARVSSLAGDVRGVGEELRRQGKDQPARLAEQAAERAESFGDYLKRSDGDRILSDLEDFGRRRPWAVIAGGLALGFAASRFLKASSSRRYEERWEQRRLTAGSDAETYGGTGAGLPNTAGYPPPRGDDPLSGARSADVLGEPGAGDLSRDYAPTPSTVDEPRTGYVPPSEQRAPRPDVPGGR